MSCARAHSPALQPARFAARRHRRASVSSLIFRPLATGTSASRPSLHGAIAGIIPVSLMGHSAPPRPRRSVLCRHAARSAAGLLAALVALSSVGCSAAPPPDEPVESSDDALTARQKMSPIREAVFAADTNNEVWFVCKAGAGGSAVRSPSARMARLLTITKIRRIPNGTAARESTSRGFAARRGSRIRPAAVEAGAESAMEDAVRRARGRHAPARRGGARACIG